GRATAPSFRRRRRGTRGGGHRSRHVHRACDAEHPCVAAARGAVATTKLATCMPEDDVHAAMATMRQARVRRLPVVGFRNTLLGIISINDIALAAGGASAVP